MSILTRSLPPFLPPPRLILRSLSSKTATKRKPTKAGPSSGTPTKNPFTAPSNSVLAYVGPFASALRSCKSVAFVFGACGCIAVPSTLFLGNTEQTLAIMAGVASLSPSALLHYFFRNDVTKIHVQGSPSTKLPSAIKVTTTDPLLFTMEKLSWRGVPKQTLVLSTDLSLGSDTDKAATWMTTKASVVVPEKGSSAALKNNSALTKDRKEVYRINKMMMMSNPSFSFVLDQIENQTQSGPART